MPILTLKFKLPEERSEAELAQKAGMLYSTCWEIQSYLRTLRKYDERENVPKEEILDKMNELLHDFYQLEVE